jgi:hypothetical protein
MASAGIRGGGFTCGGGRGVVCGLGDRHEDRVQPRGDACSAGAGGAGTGEGARAAAKFNELLALADGSEFRLAPFSATGDLVVTTADDTLVVVALSDVIGSLTEATEQ